ncbi:MAG TPA: cytochrome c-type biogenesis protein CcmH [Terriglobales bacterium]|nr:cytochrome c-type biogenesis protein CcmH [Terriglobales bacterium]
MSRICHLMVFSVIFASGAAAAQERGLTAAELKRYDKVTHVLVAPCCWREPIAIHRSPEALQMLDEVKQLIVAGRSEEEIKAIYVRRYGAGILIVPPGAEGHWLYALPVSLFTLAVFLAILRLRAPVKRTASRSPSASAELLARVRTETGNDWS